MEEVLLSSSLNTAQLVISIRTGSATSSDSPAAVAAAAAAAAAAHQHTQ